MSTLPLDPHAAPTRADTCDDLPARGGDPVILLGTDWSGEHHAYGDTVVVYACVSAKGGGQVSLVEELTGIQVRPRVAPIDPSGTGVIGFQAPFPKTRRAGSACSTSSAAEGHLTGPIAAADGDAWHFAPKRR